jgi:hypothetical protein
MMKAGDGGPRGPFNAVRTGLTAETASVSLGNIPTRRCPLFSQSRRTMKSMLLAAFVITFGLIAVGVNHPRSRMWIDHVLYRFKLGQSLVRTSTSYGEGYSESGFRKISIGISVETLRATLGQPLAHFTNQLGDETWICSFHNDSGSTTYWKSRAIYTSNNVVSGKLAFVNYD